VDLKTSLSGVCGLSPPRDFLRRKPNIGYTFRVNIQPSPLHWMQLLAASEPVAPQDAHSAQSPTLLALRIPPPHVLFLPTTRWHLAPTFMMFRLGA
jgi:hypothetical protein